MATTAIRERSRGVVARPSTDRRLLRAFLERDRLYAAYAICDLEEREFPRTRWGVATDGDDVVAVGLEYGGVTPQPLFLMGRNDGIAAIARDILRPRTAYIAAMSDTLDAIATQYRIEPGPPMIRMWVDRARFRPVPAPVERLLPVQVTELNRLYQLGFAAWLPAAAIQEGVYYGIRLHGKLVAAAGTHVISREARLAVVGNVLTHVEHRGRGYATAVTGAVTAELLRFCDQVVLNVRSDNPPAIQAYRKLGYAEHVRFEERLVRRTGSTLADLAAPFRRWLADRTAGPTRHAVPGALPGHQAYRVAVADAPETDLAAATDPATTAADPWAAVDPLTTSPAAGSDAAEAAAAAHPAAPATPPALEEPR